MKQMLVILLVCGFALQACDQEKQNETTTTTARNKIEEHDKLPDFTLKSLNGETINLRSFEGEKVVVVNFWATWCGPCRREIPDFNKVYSQYQNRDVEFLGISVDQAPKEYVPEFMKHVPIEYPVLIGSPQLTQKYGINGIPTTFIIDRSGRVVSKIVGMMSAKRLSKELDLALSSS